MTDEVQVITRRSRAYPPLLRHIYSPPEKLYVRGRSEILHHPHLLAVVGSRRANLYGKQACDLLLPPLVRAGIVLVSGLAHGIDSLAHRACVAQQQPTIAVVGSGVDDSTIYPRTNRALVHDILEHGGAIVSEYPPTTPAHPGRFPLRNRIVVGLCRAVVVVQAAKKSGSLITARLTLESNRDLYVVPNPITNELSVGVNNLLKDGATPVTAASDLLHVFNLAPAVSLDLQPKLLLSADQQTIMKHLSDTPLHIDTIVEKSTLPPEHVSTTLIQLELDGHVQNVGGMKYVRKV